MGGANPQRRHSPAVYRRRRLVVLVFALLVVVAVVWLLIAQPWRGTASEGEAATPSTTQDAATALPAPGGAAPTDGSTPAPEGSDGATTPQETPPDPPSAPECVARDIAVEAVTDQDTYGSGQNPQLSIRLTNHGSTDCTLNVGTTTQVFTVTSGSDTWWRSTDCQSAPSDMVALLAAGQTVSSAVPLAWDRTRSAVATCADPNRPKAPGGGASYHLAVEIGGIPAASTKQILLY